MGPRHVQTRRQILVTFAGAGATVLVAACAQASPSTAAPTTAAVPSAVAQPTAASAPAGPTTAPAPAQPTATAQTAAVPQPSPTVASANQAPTQLARTETLVMSESDALNQFTDVQLMNPFMPGIARSGWQFAFEPLYFYDMWWTDQVCAPTGVACKNGEIPWQAESYAYNQDFTELTIKLRNGVTWSDGQPMTASDIVYTLTMLRDNAPKLTYSVDMQNWVKDVVALDDHTAKVTLTASNPRFFFDYLMWHSDLGFPILPEHIFKGQDPTTFTNFDIGKGWPIVTGPWKLSLSSPEQKFWDRRDDWWGAKTGFHPLPKMKRVIILPNYDDAKQLELLIAGQIDSAHGFQAISSIKTALQQLPRLNSWTPGNQPPYGPVDIATITGMSFNCSKPPYDDPDIRWAINHALNRAQILQIGNQNVGATCVMPFPRYGPLAQYYDNASDILQKYPIDSFDPQKTAQIMQSKGYQKDPGGFWAKEGKRFSMVISLPPPFFTDITPVIVAQLRKAGFDADFKSPANWGTLEAQGALDAYVFVQAGSVRDPYVTLSFFTQKLTAPTGQPAVQPFRWKNDDYDKVLDQMSRTATDDPKLMNRYHQAMELWIPNLPEIPLLTRYLWVPVSEKYWTGWPDAKNPYTAPTSWHRTAGLFINTLTPAGG
jgi:peptide/nickel transport system substrate-binding protein